MVSRMPDWRFPPARICGFTAQEYSSGSVNHELLKYFNFDARTPSLSAFYQQRAKLSDDVFPKLFYSFNRCFSPRVLLKGRYQLLACDGSGFTGTRNPKDTESYYDPSGRSPKGYNRCTSSCCMTCSIRSIPTQSPAHGEKK